FFSSRRRHTRSYGDWSSDVCSSDLGDPGDLHDTVAFQIVDGDARFQAEERQQAARGQEEHDDREGALDHTWVSGSAPARGDMLQIGRASCRERVESVGGAVSVEKKM